MHSLAYKPQPEYHITFPACGPWRQYSQEASSSVAVRRSSSKSGEFMRRRQCDRTHESRVEAAYDEVGLTTHSVQRHLPRLRRHESTDADCVARYRAVVGSASCSMAPEVLLQIPVSSCSDGGSRTTALHHAGRPRSCRPT